MFYTYVLQSEKDNKLYVGFTKDLKQRFEQHQTHQTIQRDQIDQINQKNANKNFIPLNWALPEAWDRLYEPETLYEI